MFSFPLLSHRYSTNCSPPQDPQKDMPASSTCTSCQYADDFSNYWTAVLYFRAQNGTYKRVPQLGNNQFEKANGGMTVYYQQDAIYDPEQKSKVTAFKPVCGSSSQVARVKAKARMALLGQRLTTHLVPRASECSSATSTPALSPPPLASAN